MDASPTLSYRSFGSSFTEDFPSTSTTTEADPDEPREDDVPEKTVFRDYENACDRVKLFYAEQHQKQTMEFNLKARDAFKSREKKMMSVWEAMEMLNTLIDESDPDVSPLYGLFDS